MSRTKPRTKTTTTTEVVTTNTPQSITFEDVRSQSISNYTENILYARSRNITFTATGLKPLTKHYAFFDGISIDQFITSKFIEVNMISGVFEVGELVESDPLFTSGRFSFRTCTPNHLYGPSNNPSKIFTNDIIAFPLAGVYGLDKTAYSASSKSLNIDLSSLASPSEVEFFGYAQPSMKLIGRSSGAIAEVVNSILVTDESGFLTASFFIPDPTVQTNPKFINGTNTFTLTNIPNISDPNYLSSADAKYFSRGTTNITDNNNITTRNYTIIPAKTINNTIITNTTSNIVTKERTSSSPRPRTTTTTTIPTTLNTVSTPPSTTRRYEGVATGYIAATGGYGTINQNPGGTLGTGERLTQAQIGGAAVDRAFNSGFSRSQVIDWINRTGAIVGPDAKAKLGL